VSVRDCISTWPLLIRLTAAAQNIKTIGIIATIKTSIGGPTLTKGALQTYKVTNLAGTAKIVQF
jgi:hypothetical protein